MGPGALLDRLMGAFTVKRGTRSLTPKQKWLEMQAAAERDRVGFDPEQDRIDEQWETFRMGARL